MLVEKRKLRRFMDAIVVSSRCFISLQLSILHPSCRRVYGGGWVLKSYENLQSKLPILPFEEQIGFGPVGHLHFPGIPLQTLAGKLAGDHTEA